MPITTYRNRITGALDRLIDDLQDPSRRQRSLLLLLAAYALVWTVYGVISRSAQDVNADMAETVIWSRELALGYPKHPPFLPYVVRLWFSVFPVADWAYLLLALLTVSAGLYLAFQLAGEWLSGPKRVAVPFLLTLIPFYNFLGLKFDQNSALIPLWALAMWALVRSLKTRHAGWALLCGVATAAAMLTKYWSIFLLVAFAFAVLSDPERNRYLRSPAPWIIVVVFALIVAPHAVWLVQNDFPPMQWVSSRRLATGVLDWFQGLSAFVFGTAGYAVAALIAYALAIQPSREVLRDTLFPSEPERRRAAVLFWTPLMVPVAVSAAGGTGMLSLWNAPALTLLPVVLLSSPRVELPREALRGLVGFAIAVPLIALLAAPVVAVFKLRGTENHANYARMIAAATQREWTRSHRPAAAIHGRSVRIDQRGRHLCARQAAQLRRFLRLPVALGDRRAHEARRRRHRLPGRDGLVHRGNECAGVASWRRRAPQRSDVAPPLAVAAGPVRAVPDRRHPAGQMKRARLAARPSSGKPDDQYR